MNNGDKQGFRIDASPTKEFFIYMLTRDVQLTRSIIDLVDNCVDGATRLRGVDGTFTGLWVRIELDGEKFRIDDNCGGIPVETARDYAFRFGRPKEARDTPHSVGLFGVGMKRTFFKLGRFFSVKSKCRDEAFTMKVDVDAWVAESDSSIPDQWHFRFDTVDQQTSPVEESETGTEIEVTKLHPAVAGTFKLANFYQQLCTELADAHSPSIERGLDITVNHLPVNYLPQKLLSSDSLQPSYRQFEYARKILDGEEGEPVRVKLYAGLSTRDFHSGGWYVFCNGRLVLKADQTSTSIWGSNHNMPQYHADFAYFRGFAYFDSQHAALLPWTTTKTGVDTDAMLYKLVQREMIELSKPILTFLRELAKEKSGDGGDDVLEQSLSTAKSIRLQQITTPTPFRALATSPQPRGPAMQWIRYRRPLSAVNKAKELLRASTPGEVGEGTFDYYMKYEGDE